MTIGRFKVASIVPIRAVLALAFVVLSSLQPGLFANANATGFHADNGITLSADVNDHHSADAGHRGHADVLVIDEAEHSDSTTADDAGCEVHCAPLHGVPAQYSPVLPTSAGCIPQVEVDVLQPGEHAEFIRPPRSLT